MAKWKAYGKLFLFVSVSVMALPIVIGLADKITGGRVSSTLGMITGTVSNALGIPSGSASSSSEVVTVESLRA